jgi:NAD(P)-dependent dehydrogenase (short-subunit alcohol dehydrogenase family)
MEGDGIDALGLEIFQRHQRLDILVHAAATLGGLYPVAHIDPKLWDKLISTNVTSAYRLIRAMEPLLRQSEAGRALFLTTGQGVRKRAFWGGYAATKSALDTIVRCWADEVEHTQIRAVIIDPGVMRTRMRAQAFPGEDPATLVDPAEIGPMVVAYAAAADLGLPIEPARFSEWKAARALASA